MIGALTPGLIQAAESFLEPRLAGADVASIYLTRYPEGDDAGSLVWLGVLALSILAIGGMWLARGLGVPAAVWLLLAALYLPPALVNAELRLGATH